MLLLVWANPEHLEPLTLNQRVPGSSPGAPTKSLAQSTAWCHGELLVTVVASAGTK
jgi:hypothetical protein